MSYNTPKISTEIQDTTKFGQVKPSFKEIWTAKPQESVFGADGKLKEIRSLRSIWSEWLDGYNWDWWITLTFRNRVTAKTANKKWNKWLRALEMELDDKAGYFRVSEIQKRREVLHFHSLMLNLSGLHTRTMGNWLRAEKILKKGTSDPSTEEIEQLAVRLYWMDRWNEISGFSRIYKYDSGKGAAAYLTKYVSKELTDYELGGYILRT